MVQVEQRPDQDVTTQSPASAQEVISSHFHCSSHSSSSDEFNDEYNDSFGLSYSGSDLDDDSFAGDDQSDYYDEGDSDSTDAGIVRQEYKKQKNTIARKENRRVFRARIFVLTLLAITAGANAVIVYFLALNQEQKEYDHHYNALADQIMQVVGENVRTAYMGMNAFSNALVARVADTATATETENAGWPFVTIDNYGVLGQDARNVTGALQIVFVPIIQESKRVAWERYSVENNGWVQEDEEVDYRKRRQRALLERFNRSQPQEQQIIPSHSLEDCGDRKKQEARATLNNPASAETRTSQSTSTTVKRQLQYSFNDVIPERIHPTPTREEKLTPGMEYAAVWQISPIPYWRGIILHDMFREPSFQALAEAVSEKGRAVLSNELHNALVNLFFDEHNPNNPDDYESDHRYNKEPPPISIMLQPVREGIDSSSNIVGYQIALIPWESYLLDTFSPIPDNEESVLAQYHYEFSDCKEETNDKTMEKFENYKVLGGETIEYLGPGKDDFMDMDDFDFSMKKTMEFPFEAYSEDQLNRLAVNATSYQPTSNRTCGRMRVNLYPSDELRHTYMTNWPSIYAGLVVVVFFILVSAFVIYDLSVERRRGKVMAVAKKTSRIVTSLFPTQFAEQMIKDSKKKEKEARKRNKKKKVVMKEAPKRRLKAYMKKKKYENLNGNENGNRADPGLTDPIADDSPLFLAQSKPIADLFPDTTVLFTDIAGFTAWSSAREPSQVFTLLETIYASFDFLAKQYGIFKIETIGDCYVAVCGLPEPREDHAVAMSRFAQACMTKMKEVVADLEVTLGPDTGDLTMRFGLHSGPVTAGILRGERARFQLFGDTVNTAARMESTGMKDKIQISQETADCLVAAGKKHWLEKRDGLVKAKGKGELQTYWLVSTGGDRGGRRESIGGAAASQNRRGSVGGRVRRRQSLGAQSSGQPLEPHHPGHNSFSNMSLMKPKPTLMMSSVLSKKEERLVDWNCESLQQLLRQIVARRNFVKTSRLVSAVTSGLPKIGEMINNIGTGNTNPLDEVVEVVNLPEFDEASYHATIDAKSVVLDAEVVSQLRRYITILASKYRDNPFHNFDHASHVAMSVSKLLARIVAPDLASINDRHDERCDDNNNTAHIINDMKDLHDHTFGITSDPLTQFAVVFSALVHDVDHRGVPNFVLAKEEPKMAAKYNNKSIAEQNSVAIAWEIFMDSSFKALRDTICPEIVELKRLRALVVNSVMATDIFDRDLNALRKARWNKAFKIADASAPASSLKSTRQFGANTQRANDCTEVNRKATIVIEHLIQASDVSHTMQHWHIYTKWNENLFKEMYGAFKAGRVDKDPSEGWYKGEIWFYDNYVIPLAKKLKDCGVFGVSSDEYLDYAVANRNEWERKGEMIVAEMLTKYNKDHVDASALGYE